MTSPDPGVAEIVNVPAPQRDAPAPGGTTGATFIVTELVTALEHPAPEVIV